MPIKLTLHEVITAILGLIMMLAIVESKNICECIVLTLLLCVLIKKQGLYLSILDGIVLILWAYDGISLLWSISPIQPISHFQVFSLSVIYYFLLRSGFREIKNLKKLLLLYCTLFSVLGIIALVAFILFQDSLKYVEWHQLYNFKYLYQPFGILLNVWGTLVIGCASIVLITKTLCYKKRLSWMLLTFTSVILSAAALVTFSRGVYLAWLILLFGEISIIAIGLWKKTKEIQTKAWSLTITIVIVLCLVITYKGDVSTTLKFDQTLSQQKSTSGRIQSSKAAIVSFKNKFWQGVGNGNYSLAVDTIRYQADSVGFTSFAPNSLVQMGVEKGIIGLILWSILGGQLSLMIFRNRHQPVTLAVLIVFLSIGVKEMTFAVFFESQAMQLLFFTLLASYQNICPPKSVGIVSSLQCKYAVIATICLGCTVLVFSIMSQTKDKYFNEQFIDFFDKQQYDEAQQSIVKTRETAPFLINRTVLNWNYFLQTQDSSYLERAKRHLQKARQLSPQDIQLQVYESAINWAEQDTVEAIANIRTLLERFPEKSLYRLMMSFYLYKLGDIPAALPHMTKAIELNPNILDTPIWSNLQKYDRPFSDKLVNNLRLRTKEIIVKKGPSDPIALAKCGKVLLAIGDTVSAQNLLRQAVHTMPHLTRPWYYLGLIETKNSYEQGLLYLKRYITLEKDGYLTPEQVDAQSLNLLTLNKPTTNIQDIVPEYNSKFLRWYGTYTCPFILFP